MVIGEPVDAYKAFKVITPIEGLTPLDKEHTRGIKVH